MTSGTVAREPTSSNLYDVLDLILDKGLVVDAYVRVSLVGIELLTVDARIVIASVDTYLHFAESVDRLKLSGNEPEALPDLLSGDTAQDMSEAKTKGVLEGGAEKTQSAIEGGVDRLRSAVGSDQESGSGQG